MNKLIAILVMLVGGALIGAGITSGLYQRSAREHAAHPVAIIGYISCGEWKGAAVISGSGHITPIPELTYDEGKFVANALPDGASAIVKFPCAHSEDNGT